MAKRNTALQPSVGFPMAGSGASHLFPGVLTKVLKLNR